MTNLALGWPGPLCPTVPAFDFWPGLLNSLLAELRGPSLHFLSKTEVFITSFWERGTFYAYVFIFIFCNKHELLLLGKQLHDLGKGLETDLLMVISEA